MASVFQELARERQENIRLLKAHQDKDDLIGRLKEEIDLLNRVSPVRFDSLIQDLNRHRAASRKNSPSQSRVPWASSRGVWMDCLVTFKSVLGFSGND